MNIDWNKVERYIELYEEADDLEAQIRDLTSRLDTVRRGLSEMHVIETFDLPEYPRHYQRFIQGSYGRLYRASSDGSGALEFSRVDVVSRPDEPVAVEG